MIPSITSMLSVWRGRLIAAASASSTMMGAPTPAVAALATKHCPTTVALRATLFAAPACPGGSRQPCSCVGSKRRHNHGCELTKHWQLQRCRLLLPELENSGRGGVDGPFFQCADRNGSYNRPGVDCSCLSLWTGRNSCQNNGAEGAVLQPRILCKEVACTLITA